MFSKPALYISGLFIISMIYLYKDSDPFTGRLRQASTTENIQKENLIKNEQTIPDKINPDINRDYLKLHYSSILVDTHNDFIWKVYDKGAVFGKHNSFTQSDLPRFKEGGVDVQFFAIWIPMKKLKSSFAFVESQINRLKQFEISNPDDIEFTGNYSGVTNILSKNKMCGLIGVEGGTAIGNDINNVDRLYNLGVRYIGLTWNNSNNIAVSARDQTEAGKKGGLTDFGKQVLQRMNELGIMVDAAHLGEDAFWDIAKITDKPIFSSHSNCYSINPHYRNLTDDQIKAIAKSGGVVQVNFYDEFLDKNARLQRTENAYEKFGPELNALNEKYGDDLEEFNKRRDQFLEKKNISGGTNADKVIEHIEYIINLVGIDYVGIGSDFDGGISPPVELYDASCYPVITKKLVQKGYSDEDIKKILGLNILRVFKQVCG